MKNNKIKMTGFKSNLTNFILIVLFFSILMECSTEEDSIEDCKKKVFAVFPENTDPFIHFITAFHFYDMIYLKSKNEHALGYFKFLVGPIEFQKKNIFTSPREFCNEIDKNGKVIRADLERCYQALAVMVSPKKLIMSSQDYGNGSGEDELIMSSQDYGNGSDEDEPIMPPQDSANECDEDDVQLIDISLLKEMTGQEAFELVYLNQISLELRKDIALGNSSSGIEIQTKENQDYEDNEKTKYFNMLYNQTIQLDPRLFPTIQQYCEWAAVTVYFEEHSYT